MSNIFVNSNENTGSTYIFITGGGLGTGLRKRGRVRILSTLLVTIVDFWLKPKRKHSIFLGI